ncbi:MAG: hypothetical protein VKN72_00160 [Nostocales cyanobacterium 94392]|nr:hypothetical protein [Nostocales cyanobacterium 94392]
MIRLQEEELIVIYFALMEIEDKLLSYGQAPNNVTTGTKLGWVADY